ncbi:hypothetical protein [Aquimarina litoralis]|uniref:hypothetical protein n=1 Tax=Aquimarina litoralis TaxID=584605 RepID=UPI001C58E7F4|nr:hypothetical protein [Aquimarina litoralis]MBW1299063.1 hypothetical protein [Aquimarina litoralis]
MNNKTKSSIYFLSEFVFILLIYSIIIQPAIQTFSFFIGDDYELVNHNWDKDIEEEEIQEKEDKKIEERLIKESSYAAPYNRKTLYPSKKNSICNIHLDILIPPPEQA